MKHQKDITQFTKAQIHCFVYPFPKMSRKCEGVHKTFLIGSLPQEFRKTIGLVYEGKLDVYFLGKLKSVKYLKKVLL